MLSEDQRINKKRRVKECVNLLVGRKLTNKQIEEETGISKSSVQRYLHDEDFIIEVCKEEGLDVESTNYVIQIINEILEENKEKAASNGGKKAQELNDFYKDSSGKFKSSGPRI